MTSPKVAAGLKGPLCLNSSGISVEIPSSLVLVLWDSGKCSLPGVVNTRSTVWASEKCRFALPPPDLPNPKLGAGPSNLCFNKSFRWCCVSLLSGLCDSLGRARGLNPDRDKFHPWSFIVPHFSWRSVLKRGRWALTQTKEKNMKLSTVPNPLPGMFQIYYRISSKCIPTAPA